MIRLRDLVRSHFTGREGGMTTVWRPRVRIPVPDIDGADADENRRDESTTKGTKRKRAPHTKGPCEHGVKPRSKCKVCGACPHGRRPSQCKECGGSAICEHGRQRPQCKECGGSGICEHGRVALFVQGVRWCINMRARSSALCVQGVRWVINMRARSSRSLSARSAVGHQSASTVVGALSARSATRRNSRLVLLLNVAI